MYIRFKAGLLLLCLLLSVFSIGGCLSEDIDIEKKEEGVYPIFDAQMYEDTNPYRLVISSTVEKLGFLYDTRVRFDVYCGDTLYATYTTPSDPAIEKWDLKKVFKKDDSISALYEEYERLLQNESYLAVLGQFYDEKYVRAENKNLGTLQTDVSELGDQLIEDFRKNVSDIEFEMIENIILSAIDDANAVIRSGSDDDAVFEFIGEVLGNWFDKHEDNQNPYSDFSSVIAAKMGKMGFTVLDGWTYQMFEAVNLINPDGAQNFYIEQSRAHRKNIIDKIIEIGKIEE